jgi:hypothetical protein
MGDTDISPRIKEDVDQGYARNQTSQPERLKDPSPARAVLPSGIIHSELNPYVLCHVLFQRTRQLAARNPGTLLPSDQDHQGGVPRGKTGVCDPAVLP